MVRFAYAGESTTESRKVVREEGRLAKLARENDEDDSDVSVFSFSEAFSLA